MLDHDDTSVDSTPHIHYPCYLQFMKNHPHDAILSYNEWFKMLWHEGLFNYYRKELKMTEDQVKEAVDDSRQYGLTHESAKFFPGFIPLLKAFKARGGILVVVSFSSAENINKHYNEQTKGEILPDFVYDWKHDAPEQCKPFPYPVFDVMKRYNLKKEDILVVDDMLPGLTMARKAGVKCAGAVYGKGHEVLQTELSEASDYLCASVEDLQRLVITEKEE
ncbi:hypothetical protein EIN_409900 [Entamoeba invadens IP1]|uniref:Phosphoglycolate phosphatase n=1 Tax=Entamoeba invadens IP1 TaxID=370355 RepID=A0A0A1TWU2_ENTIV|nr:hypothetical protein EIN_409900 [Entamoeba invadens IP1]ELP85671.1 hypothetical protein EIN_409900 [Entamoeba invadens IP1]|eukprot:XP_004185017.1 hypothetical protein EIN_409900 [Entamoeba invadens IP1]